MGFSVKETRNYDKVYQHLFKRDGSKAIWLRLNINEGGGSHIGLAGCVPLSKSPK